jgi:NAD(P)-dependent dehydrogenase (short-subunit alcohol dehydrogenase family)
LSMPSLSDNITYYQCDVTKWEEVEAVAKKVIEEVRRPRFHLFTIL